MKTLQFTTLFFLILLLTTIGLTDANAQGSRNFITVSGGYSLPIGKYASERLADPDYGLAGSGYFGQVAYEHRFLFWLGMRVSGNLTINKTNPGPIITRSQQYLELVRPLLSNGNDTYSWTTKTSEWRVASAMVGPALYLYLGRVQLEGHVLGGYVQVQSPSIKVYGESSSGENPVEGSMASSNSGKFGAGIGTSIKIPLSKHLNFQIAADLIGTNAEFDDLVLLGKIGSYPPQEQARTEKRLISVVNLGAGFTIEF